MSLTIARSAKDERDSARTTTVKLSKRTEYGLKAVVQLARLWPATFVQSRDLAASEDLPNKFLESILLALRRGVPVTEGDRRSKGLQAHVPRAGVTRKVTAHSTSEGSDYVPK